MFRADIHRTRGQILALFGILFWAGMTVFWLGAESGSNAGSVALGTSDTRVRVAAARVPPTLDPRAGPSARVVHSMIELLDVEPGDRILELGTGSGYAAALLEELGATVLTMTPTVAEAAEAKAALREAGYDARVVVLESGEVWPGVELFDGILVRTSTDIGEPVLRKLRPGARLVIVGPSDAEVAVYERAPTGQVRSERFPRTR